MNLKVNLENSLFLFVRYTAQFMPLIVIAGLWFGGWASFAGFALVFGIYFGVEIVLMATGLGRNTTVADEFKYVGPHRFNWLDQHGLKLYGFMQILLVPATAVWLVQPGRTGIELWGGILSIAVMSGSVGGLAGHELIHRRDPWEKLLGITIFSSVSYGHFTVSHLLGHHHKIGLPNDWSTSKKGESSYRFLYRALVHGYVGAWTLTATKLRKQRRAFFSLENFMLKLTAAYSIFLLGFGIAFGLKAVGFFLLISFLAASLMEMVNYLSHYGITRAKEPTGRLETVKNKHSWESNNKVTNWFIFNAGKHCHHHRVPTAPHHLLELAHESEYLPYGLPLMTIIAFVPPLYFRLMNPRLEKRLKQQAKRA